MLKSKIHRATVTEADLHYVGSLTVDSELLSSAGIHPGEQVTVADVTNGARLETYIIEGKAGSGVIGVNGAAAHLIHPGDIVIIIAYAMVADHEVPSFRSRVVHVDATNRCVALGSDPAASLVPDCERSPLAVHPAAVTP